MLKFDVNIIVLQLLKLYGVIIMYNKQFFSKCDSCERQFITSVSGVKDNYFKCRVRKIALKKLYEGINECPYYKEKENG